ncbi:hypothetical protein QWM81_03105 [Streptomyces ficellus]|uniref:WD40 repeat domain-containing protein n=1 Tax=Streptomyces ficellus TaxID=1977088 RepID=A0ABT7Z0M9_9ACTN|nr:hypothetical protein [Streptomyces ficellus]MDN3293049.1 hypothetical protein [Streptomyces ficellus]
MRFVAAFALVSLFLAGCTQPSEEGVLDGTDAITEKPSSVSPTLDRQFDLERRAIEGSHISPDGRYEARHTNGRLVITSAQGDEFDSFDTGSDWGDPPMDFSPDGRFLAVAVSDSVILYDFATKNPRAILGQQLMNIRFSADSAYLVGEEFIEDRSGRYVLFNVRTGQRSTSPQPPTVKRDDATIWVADELAVFDAGKHVVAAGADGYFFWSTSEREVEWVPCGCQSTGAAIDRRAHRVAYILPEGISLWERSTRREVSRWKLPPVVQDGYERSYAGADMAFSEDGKWLLTYFLDSGRVWSVPDGKQVGSWKGAAQ